MLASLVLWTACGPQIGPPDSGAEGDGRVELRLEESPHEAAMGFWTSVLSHAEGVVVCRFEGHPATESVERVFAPEEGADGRQAQVHRLRVERVLFGDLTPGAELWIELPSATRAAGVEDFGSSGAAPLLVPAEGDRWLVAIDSTLERVRFDDGRAPVRLTRFFPTAVALLGERGSALTRTDLEIDFGARRVVPRRLISGPFRQGALERAVEELIEETTPSLLLQTFNMELSSPLWLLPGDAPAGPIGGQGLTPLQVIPNAMSVGPIASRSESDDWAPSWTPLYVCSSFARLTVLRPDGRREAHISGRAPLDALWGPVVVDDLLRDLDQPTLSEHSIHGFLKP